VFGAGPPAAEGHWGSAGESPNRRRVGSGTKAPSYRRQGGLGEKPPALGEA